MSTSPGNSFDPKSYWEERLSGEFSLRGVGRSSLAAGYNQAVYRVRRVAFDRAIERLRRSGRTFSDVIDLGSGTGFYVERWRRAGATHVTGLDITETAVRALKAAYPESTFLRADASELSGLVEEARFDAASAMDMLFHIVDDDKYEAVFRAVGRALRPGGVFLFTELMLTARQADSAHQVGRTADEIDTLLDRYGFDVVWRQPAFVLLENPVDSTSRLHRLWWRYLKRAARRQWAGRLISAALVPLESWLIARVRRSPSTELIVCERRKELK